MQTHPLFFTFRLLPDFYHNPMCKRCVIFAYDEVLGIVQRLEVGRR